MAGREIKTLLMVPPLRMRDIANEPYPPIGLSYIAACLEENGFGVRILDAFSEGRENIGQEGDYFTVGLPEEAIRERLLEYKPDIVGISWNFTNFFDSRLQIADLVKSTLPKCLVVLGGAHVTMEYRNSMDNPHVDLIVRGEGEHVMVEIAERLKRGEPLHDIEGTVAKFEGKIVENPLRELISDLDALPLPAYHLLKMDIYLRDQRKSIFPFAMRTPVGFMISSRGCHFNCIFCSTSKMFRKFRPRNPNRVVDEIEYLMKEYGVREIAFQDDCFLGDLKNVKALCEEILKRKIDIKWSVPPGLPVWRAEEDLLKLMKSSGFYRVCFPIESGCEKTLKFIRKPVNLKKARETIVSANRLGLWTYGNLVFGFPYETEDDIKDSFQYFLDSGLDMLSVYICQPYAGSDLYSVYKEEGLLKGGLKTGSYLFKTQYDSKNLTADELNSLRSEILSRFMRNRLFSLLTPRGLYLHLISKIRSTEDLLYVIRILVQVVKASIRSHSLSYF